MNPFIVEVLRRPVESTLVKQVTLKGDEGSAPQPGKIGLGFFLPGFPEGTATAVLPDGEAQELPAVDGAKTSGAATIGSAALTITSDIPDVKDGFVGPGYDSTDLAPSDKHTSGAVEASNADDWLVASFAMPTRTEVYRVLDAASGDVLSEPDCDPHGVQQIAMSPDRSWGVLGPMRLDKAGAATCFGGEEQREVRLTAVTDEGRAFGVATEGGTDDLLVDINPSGDITTTALTGGATPPVGVMSGGVAIHWDPLKAALTANPIK